MRCTTPSRRSEKFDLPAWNGTDPRPDRFFRGESGEAAFRLLEFHSLQLKPFAVTIEWEGLGIQGKKAYLTLSPSGRVCVFASTVTARLFNQDDAENQVVATMIDVADFVQTHNQFLSPGAVDNSTQDIDIPPFAKRFRVDVNSPSSYSATAIRTFDGQGTKRLDLTANNQPETLPIGGAEKIQIYSSGAVTFQVVFFLDL